MPLRKRTSGLVAHRSVWGAIIADVCIAIAKLAAFSQTGSAAMLAEVVHSLVDAGNGSLLLVGIRLSRKPADETHPFGYGKELYFWALIVALLVFSFGGGLSILDGIRHIQHPNPVREPLWNYAVLAVSSLFEASSLVVALHQFRPTQGRLSLWKAIQRSKDPSTFTIIFEDSAALVGLAIAAAGLLLQQFAGWSTADGWASVAIGLLLMLVAYLLITETRALLVGEGAEPATLRSIRELALEDRAVERAGYPLTMYFGPDRVLLTMDVQFRPSLSGAAIEQSVDRIEAAIRERFPMVKYIYLEVEALRSIPRGEELSFPTPPEPPPENE